MKDAAKATCPGGEIWEQASGINIEVFLGGGAVRIQRQKIEVGGTV